MQSASNILEQIYTDFSSAGPHNPLSPVLFEPRHDCHCTFIGHSGILCCCLNIRNIHWRTTVHFSMTHFKTGGGKVLHCQIIFTSKLLRKTFCFQPEFIKNFTVWTILLEEYKRVWICESGNINSSRTNCWHSWNTTAFTRIKHCHLYLQLVIILCTQKKKALCENLLWKAYKKVKILRVLCSPGDTVCSLPS